MKLCVLIASSTDSRTASRIRLPQSSLCVNAVLCSVFLSCQAQHIFLMTIPFSTQPTSPTQPRFLFLIKFINKHHHTGYGKRLHLCWTPGMICYCTTMMTRGLPPHAPPPLSSVSFPRQNNWHCWHHGKNNLYCYAVCICNNAYGKRKPVSRINSENGGRTRNGYTSN